MPVRLWSVDLLPLWLLLVAAGCSGSDGVHVGGEVTWNGTPLPNGEIILSPTAGTRATTAAGEISDGRFDIPARLGPVPGTYRVEITADRPTGRKVQADEASTEMVDQTEQFIPAHYNENSTLTIDVAKGMPELSIKLTADESPAG